MRLRNGNPALSDSTFERIAQSGVYGASPSAGVMTVEGTINKTLILLFLAVVGAGWMWGQVLDPNAPDGIWPLAFGGMLVAFIVGLVTCFKPNWARFLAPIYALLEGVGLGAISAIVNQRYPGVATEAVGLTFGVMAVMLVAYRTGLIRVTDKLRMGIVAMFGHTDAYMARYSLADTSPLAIGISLVVVAIAAFNLVLDFDFIDRGARQRLPAWMEWYGAFGLMVTLFWLYLELLRLLARLNSSRR
jgi:uncharacterized YccA/Bax inhibitor family protein